MKTLARLQNGKRTAVFFHTKLFYSRRTATTQRCGAHEAALPANHSPARPPSAGNLTTSCLRQASTSKHPRLSILRFLPHRPYIYPTCFPYLSPLLPFSLPSEKVSECIRASHMVIRDSIFSHQLPHLNPTRRNTITLARYQGGRNGNRLSSLHIEQQSISPSVHQSISPIAVA